MNRQSISRLARCTRAAGTSEAPDRTVVRLDRSREGKSAWPSIARIIVGTISVMLPRSDSISSSIWAGSNPGATTNVPSRLRQPSRQTAAPPMWNIGIALTHTPPSGKPDRIAT